MPTSAFHGGPPACPAPLLYGDLGYVKCLDASSLSNCQADGTQLTYPPPGPNAVRPHAPTHINGQAVTHNAAGNLVGWGGASL